nr:transglycosylase domain-containing protein [Ottowia testudinis]
MLATSIRRWTLGLTLTLTLTLSAAAHALPNFDQVRADFRPSETQLLDRHGEPLQRLRSDAQVRRGDWVRLAGISPALRQALVLSEDKRFYEHSGVDWRAVSSAAWANLWHTRTRGASTLTMQLAGLLDDDLALGTGGRTLRQKIGQAVMATRLEARWRKDQILEAYLNLVPFRGELVGIDALSRTLFAKAPHGLQDHEAAIAAALVRAPNARPALVSARACGVLKTMRAGDAGVDCVALDMQAEAALSRRAWAPSDGVAPHLARRLLAGAAANGAPPPALPSTLDGPLQRLALRTLQRQVRELRGRNVADGAVLVIDNASGEVLAWVGSTGELSQAADVDGVTAERQPGSTLKPFLYAQAIAEKRLTAASLLDDSPAHLQTASGLYIPQNYDRSFKGHVSARTALAASLNVPAVRTLVMVSPEAFRRQLGAFGIPLREGGDYYGYSLALGSAEVSLLQLTNAFRALTNGGKLCPVRWQPAPLPRPSGERAGSEGAATPRGADLPSPHPLPPAGEGQHSLHPRHRPRRRLHRDRHPGRPRRARAHLRHRLDPGHALLDGGKNRHQQGHARQLGRGQQRALHRRRVGRQRQRRGDVGRQRHQRRRARVGRADAPPARAHPFARARAACWRGASRRALWRRAGSSARRMVSVRHPAGPFCYGYRS